MSRQKTTLKSAIRQIHLILGLASGLVVFVVAIAAAILSFEEEGRELFQHDFYHVKEVSYARLPFKQMQDSVKAHYPKFKVSSIRFKETKDAAIIFYSKKEMAVSVDPYTSKINGVLNLKKDFFTVVLSLHTHLLLGEVGGTIVKVNVLIFFIMCVSGLVLWWPKQKRFFKQALTINFKIKNWKRLNWDLHSVLGFYAMLVLVLVSLTGMFFVYDSVKSTAAFITGNRAPKKEKVKIAQGDKKTFNTDKAYNYMVSNYPGAIETFITPAASKTDAIRIQMRYPYTIVRQQNSVYFDPYTGNIVRADLYKNYNGYDRIAASNYNLHTGRFQLVGIGGKVIYFLTALIAASLPVTGFMIWLGRRKKKKPLRRHPKRYAKPLPIS
ncbi:PepSY-associated TM helix domain-containing protein [Mucilaginibacter sp. KACC 22063]|uniref:PepSY-associated TM helix domain-containing protein n=1 Tax=Mucilaginibacter sp. KACC 22063 TaxID=3025666 RepID=UPI0023656335|nr:PepSY-associated TM helix domain-containing protein [Mucilaginibacter sp. KACC 22063]WDF54862.1 PepSY-associated TM helix domain-containing protein [Mucilaginibacter sp. KACC 22063]